MKRKPVGFIWVYVIENSNKEWFRADEQGFTDKFSQTLKFRGQDAEPMAKLFIAIFKEKLNLSGCIVRALPEIIFRIHY